jgi:hypothetical protein
LIINALRINAVVGPHDRDTDKSFPVGCKVMKRILSIDGGGVRGLFPAAVCENLAPLADAPIHELFDLISGTSTGGINYRQ